MNGASVAAMQKTYPARSTSSNRIRNLSNLAKECLVNRRTIQIYESSNRALSEKIKELQAELTKIKEKCLISLENEQENLKASVPEL